MDGTKKNFGKKPGMNINRNDCLYVCVNVCMRERVYMTVCA